MAILKYFLAIWYIFPRLVCCNKKKYGNPEVELGWTCLRLRGLVGIYLGEIFSIFSDLS
jgi:hypothetical protein